MAYEQIFDQAGRQYNVDPRLLMAQMQVESGGNPNAVSGQGAQGAMQIMPDTQRSLGVTDPNNPSQSINGAAKLMAENLDRYGNVADAVSAYHGGTDQSAWGPKTQAYTQKVMAGYGQPQAQPHQPLPGIPSGNGPAQQAQPQAQPQDDLSSDFSMPAQKGPAPAAASPPQVVAAHDDLASDFMMPAQAKTPQVVAPGSLVSLVAPGLVQQQPQGILGRTADAATKYVQDIGGGALEGVQRGLDTPAEWLAKGLDNSGATAYLQSKGIDPGTYDQQVAADKARRSAYDATDPSIVSSIAKLGGEMAGPVGELGSAGKIAAYGGNALLDGLRAVPVAAEAAPALASAGQFVSGGGGLLSRIANMSGQGAAGAALTSGGGNETPVADQMKLGALLGGALPVAGSIAKGVGSLGQGAYQGLMRLAGGGQDSAINDLVSGVAQKAAPNLGDLPKGATLDDIGKAASTAGKSGPAQAANALEDALTGVDPAKSSPATAQDPATGANAIEDALSGKASGAPVGANFTEYVPGSRPTLAQATGNSGIAELERAANSQNSAPFTALEQANNNARGNFLQQIRGTPETLSDLQAAREATTTPMREAALENATGPADVQPVVDTIKRILGSPSGQEDAVVSAMNKVLGKIQGGDGSLQTDAAQLYGIRKSINNQLQVVAGKDSSEAQHATGELLEVKKALDDAIEPVAPGFGDYLSTYANMSKPIEAQQFLQGKDLTDATSSQFSLNKTKNLLLTIQRMQSAPGANAAKSISPEQMQGLQALHSDLQRQANSMLGVGKNSATMQLINGNALLNGVTGGGVVSKFGPHTVGATLGGAIGGAPGAAIGGALGHLAGSALESTAATRSAELNSKLVDLLLGRGGPESLRMLVPKAQQGANGLSDLLNRGAGASAAGDVENQ